MIELHWIRIKLNEWGRRSRAVGIGYPTMAATEKARVGRGGAFNGPSLPPDLEEIDAAVSRADPQHRLILVECYTKGGQWRDHAARLRLSADSYFRRKKKAELVLYLTLRRANEPVASRAG